TILRGRRFAPDLSNGREVVVIQPATEGVREQFLDDRIDELLAAAQQERPQPLGAFEWRTAKERGRRVDGCPRLALRAPLADRVEVLERESERVHRRMTCRAGGIFPVLLEPLAYRCGLAVLAAIFQARHIWRRLRRGSAKNIV